jgi:hypothetical protein
MYRELYDAKHRFLALSSTPATHVRLHQKGLRERLLCEACEALFNRFETYVADVLEGKYGICYQVRGDTVEIRDLDYTKTKLFLFSLLWRFGVTTVPELKEVNLGMHGVRLRHMLLTENPGDPLIYPCLITAIMLDGEHVGGLSGKPSLAQMHGQDVWRIVVAGIVFKFFVSEQPAVGIPDFLFLQKDGSITVPMRELTKIGFLCQDISRIEEAQRRRDGIGAGTGRERRTFAHGAKNAR